MATAKPKRPKCDRAMAEGFLAVRSRAGMVFSMEQWEEGPPERSFWSGIKQKSKPVALATWRCPGCGYLESYAN